jgi:hypothetical protein
MSYLSGGGRQTWTRNWADLAMEAVTRLDARAPRQNVLYVRNDYFKPAGLWRDRRSRESRRAATVTAPTATVTGRASVPGPRLVRVSRCCARTWKRSTPPTPAMDYSTPALSSIRRKLRYSATSSKASWTRSLAAKKTRLPPVLQLDRDLSRLPDQHYQLCGLWRVSDVFRGSIENRRMLEIAAHLSEAQLLQVWSDTIE